MFDHDKRACCRIYHPDGQPRVIRQSYDAIGPVPGAMPPRRAIDVSVTSIMTHDVICAQRTLGGNALVQLMVRHRIGAIPVVNEHGKPLGMVTKLDLVEQLASLSHRTAEDVMMPLALTLEVHATVADAAAMMSLEWVHHIPVVSAAGIVVGMVSSLDIARWVADNEGLRAEGVAQELPAYWLRE